MQDDQQPQGSSTFDTAPSSPSVAAGPTSGLQPTAPAAHEASMQPAFIPAAAATAEPNVSGPAAPTIMKPSKRTWFKKPIIMAAGGVVLALLVGGGLVFGFYLPNTPDWMYGESLQNTGLALDTLINYSKTQNSAQYKGSTYDGSLSLKSPSGSMDASLTGASDTSGNANISISANVMGEKGSANIRAIHVAGTTSPDVYVQVNGIRPLLDSAGLSPLDSLDGQWIAIDHTLIDTYAAQMAANGGSTASKNAVTAPSYDQINDAAVRVQTVNKDYLFTTDSSKAVLKEQRFVATETVSGRAMNHYAVSFDASHFTAYIDALKTALDGSKLNDWAKQANGSNLSTMLNLDKLKTDVQSAKAGTTFDLWTDNQMRLVGKMAFKDPTDGSTLAVSQDYHGGSQYPFTLTVSGKDDSGNPENVTLSLALDTSTNKVTAVLDFTSKATEGTTTVDATVHATPSSKSVEVTVPAGARPVVDVLSEFGLGGLAEPTPGSGMTANPFGTLGSSGVQI